MPRVPPLLVVLLVALASLHLRPVVSLDVWWHLAMGEAVLAEGARTVAEPVAWLGPDHYVDPEWLFDVIAVGVEALGGPVALQVWVALAAVASAVATYALAREVGADEDGAIVLTGLVGLATSFRFLPRPQIAFLVLLPTVLWLAFVARRSSSGRRWAGLIGLHGLLAVWAQSHSSIAIAPAVVLAVLCAPLVPRLVRGAWPDGVPAYDLPQGLGIAALAVWPLTGAHGVGIVDQILRHSDGDATIYISDMRPPTWAELLFPASSPSFLLAEVLVVAAVVGAGVRRRGDVGSWALVALGFAMTMTANRFRAAWALLTVPLASSALGGFAPGRLASGSVTGLAVVLAAILGRGLGFGLDRGMIAVDLAEAIEAHGVSGRILNEYDAGGYLGWRLAPDVRVSIDGRTPTHFDADELFLYRRMVRDEAVLAAVVGMHAPDAVAFRRDRPVCGWLADRFTPVWTDDRVVLFVASTEDPAVAEPCLTPVDPTPAVTVDPALLARWDGEATRDEVRAEAAAVVAADGHEADPAVRGRLARACWAAGDMPCAVRQAWRGALQGDAVATEVLAVVPPPEGTPWVARVADLRAHLQASSDPNHPAP